MQKNIDNATLMNEIILELETRDLVPEGKLNELKLVLEICLSSYQIVTETETSVSTDLDQTGFYLEQFLLSMKLRGCTEGSIKTYKSDLKNFLTFIDKPIPDITYRNIMNYLANGKLKRNWKDRTYNAKLIEIRSFFAYLYEEDYIADNPGKKLHETKVERKIGPTINAYQREAVKCACIDEKELALCETLYSTGARISELCNLNINDIDFDNMSAIVYGKGRKEREIYFSDSAKLHLQRYLKSRKDDNEALFISARKPYRRMSPAGARGMLVSIKSRDAYTKKLRLTPHVYRRSVGTDMINKGAPLELVAEKLGHEHIDTTRTCYTAINKNTVRNAHNRFVN